MDETQEERRQRIAKLRAQRKQGTPVNVSQNDNVTNPSVSKPINHTSKEQDDSITTNEEDHKFTNILRISDTETVEIASHEIRDRILQKSREIAGIAYDPNINMDSDEKQPLAYNKDLKESLGPQLKMAELQTNRVINQFLQEKVQKRLQE